MNAPEQLFSTAQSFLLAPHDLETGKLAGVFGSLLSHRLDYADLYFQYSRSEGWSLEEGIVKSGSFSIDQGVGVRAIAGEKTAFAYSDEISLPALEDAAKATRAIARSGGRAHPAKVRKGAGLQLYRPIDPLASLEDMHKVKLLERLEQLCRARDPRVIQVMANLGAEYEVVLVARSDGVQAADVRPLVRLSVQVIVEQNGRREQGTAGGGGRSGHGLEGDFNRKGSSAFAGKIGKKVAARGVTVVDDGTIPGRRGSLSIDDEGNPTQRNTLIEDGVLRGYMQDSLNARLMGVPVTGNGRRESFAHVVMPRMTNTYMLNGDQDPKEILASVKKGLYAVNFGGGQVDITSGKFVFSASEAYMIENGKVTYPVKGATLIGNGPDALTRVSMIGNDLALDTGVGTCGKEGQSVPVGVGQPTLRIDGLTVGGTA